MPQGHEHSCWVSGLLCSSSLTPKLVIIHRLRLTLGCRHYVAFIRKQLDKPSWVLFNDEKVVQAVDIDEMRKFGYAYFFKRVQN